MSNLKALQITPQDIAHTFDAAHDFKGTDGFNVYQRVFEAYQQLGDKDVNFSGHFARSQGVNGRGDPEYRRFYELAQRFLKGQYPVPIQALQVLCRLGVFEALEDPIDLSRLSAFTDRHPLFPLVSLFATLEFWSGAAIHSRQNDLASTVLGFTLVTRSLDESQTAILHPLLEHAAQSGWLIPASVDALENGITQNLRFCGAAARFMCLFTGMVGAKREQDLLFPLHVMRALQTFEDPSSDGRDLAYRVLQDFVHGGFVVRGGVPRDRDWHGISLSTYGRAEQANAQTQLYQQIFAWVYPEIELRFTVMSNKDETYATRVSCQPAVTAQMRADFAQRIRELCVKPA